MKKTQTTLLIILISMFNLNAQFNLSVETYTYSNYANVFSPGYYFGAVDIEPKASTIVETDQDGSDKIVSFYSVNNQAVWLTVVDNNGTVLASKRIRATMLGNPSFLNSISPFVGQDLIVTAATSHPEEPGVVIFTGSLRDPNNSNRTVMYIASIDINSFSIQSTVIDLPNTSGSYNEGVQVKHISGSEFFVLGNSTGSNSITRYNASANTSNTHLISNTDLIANDFEFSNSNPDPNVIVIAGYTVKNVVGSFDVCGRLLGSETNSGRKIYFTFLEYDFNSNNINVIKDYQSDKLYTSLNGNNTVPGVSSQIFRNSMEIIKNDEMYIVLSKNVRHVGTSGRGYQSMLLQLDNQYDLQDNATFYHNTNGKNDQEGRLAKISNEEFVISMHYSGQGITGLSDRGTIIGTSTFADPFITTDALFRHDVNSINAGNSNATNILGEYNASSLTANSNRIYSSHGTMNSNFTSSSMNVAYIFSFDPDYKYDREVCEFETTIEYFHNCVEDISLERPISISMINSSAITLSVYDNSYDALYCNSSLGRLKGDAGFEEAQGFDSNAEMEIFPNPTSGILNLSYLNQDSKVLRLDVKNMLGQVVYSEMLGGKEQINKQLDLTSFEKGVYYISLGNETENQQKIVVVH